MTATQKKIKPAKLSIPRLRSVFRRDRLHALWDKARSEGCQVLWLSAPGGSGKTLAVADYLRQKKLPTTWYQFDEADTDPASFFHHLTQASETRKPASLPSLTAEYSFGLETFARNYFRELGQHLKTPGLLVFDNYQDLPGQSIINTLLPVGITALPADITVVIISRIEPPESFIRLRAHGDLRLYDWETLKLTHDETGEVCKFLEGSDVAPDHIERLYESTHGWITGLVLMLESKQEPRAEADQQELIFSYFAREIFARADQDVQELLLKTAMLPEMTIETIIAVTGQPNAREIIEDLHRRNFFIVELGHDPVYYRYHPLFQQYLIGAAQARYPEVEYKSLVEKSANALRLTKKPELAIPLYLASENYAVACNLLLQIVEPLHKQGRDATLREWINKLPGELAMNNGWIQYWLGQTMIAFDPLQAHDCFERAYQIFSESNEVNGQYRAISGGCRSLYVSQREQTGQDVWINRIVELDKICPLTSVNTDTADILANVLLVMHWRDPTNKYMLKYLVEAEKIWSETNDVDKRLNLGVTIVCLWGGLGNVREGIALLQQQQQLAERLPRVSLSVLWHYMYVGFSNCFAGQLDKSQAAIDRALGLAESSGIHVADLLLLGVGAHNPLLTGRLSLADHYLDRMQPILASMPLNLDAAHYHILRGWRNLWGKDYQAALMESQKAVAIAETIGAKYPLSLCKYGLAHAHIANGDFDQAQTLLHLAHSPFGEGTYRRLDYEIALAEVYIDILTGNRQGAIEKIKQGMQIAVADGYGPPLWGYPDFLLAVFGLALEEQIEVPYIQKLIQIACLVPDSPPLHLYNWPYPIKIYTLGRFSLLRGDAPLQMANKEQSRPLEMLKMLIAFGGRGISEELFNEHMWPDAEGDAAHSSFATTLSRLRKLLGQDTLLLSGGKLSLDDRRCWIDVWACERLLGQLDHLFETDEPPEVIKNLLAKAIELHRGPFLQAENGGWAITLREKIRTRLLRNIKKLILLSHDCQQVIELHEQALQLDDLSEDSYRGLMACLAAQGNVAKACAVYHRCQNILHTTFGIEPSAQTRQTYDAIKNENQAEIMNACKTCKRENNALP
ncbi:MAG TPA: hypothetical protein ENG96_07025 [Gammaproteobacteria bacterium]|nr:hypothetical protein [Gammaproteobacteria bacterium]